MNGSPRFKLIGSTCSIAITLSSIAPTLTKREHRELTSRFIALLPQLLKVREQPEMTSKSWNRSIVQQQRQIELMATPSLPPQTEAFAADADPYPPPPVPLRWKRR